VEAGSPNHESLRWRRAAEPVGAHDLAAALLSRRRYEHSRGVAQQAARLARASRLPRDRRARLLCAAWLHDLGHGLGPGFHPLLAARALRRAGHEPLARLVAHHLGAAFEAAILGLPPLGREFPAPAGADAALLTLLDVADVTTGTDGARVTPATRLRELVAGRPPGDPAVRVLVHTVSRLGAEDGSRALVEHVSPRASN
jgi:HD domain-containing protein